MENITQRIRYKKCLLLFLLLFTCALTINLIGNYWLYTIKNNGFSDKIVNNILNPLNFLFLLGTLLRDILITTGLVFALFNGIKKKALFIDLLYITMYASFVFVVQNICDLAWVYSYKNELSINEIVDFQSLSLYNCFETTPSYLYHAAVTLNLWELLYMFALALLLRTRLDESLIKSFWLVFLAYGMPLILWIIFATFIQISNT